MGQATHAGLEQKKEGETAPWGMEHPKTAQKFTQANQQHSR
jgi:hypothetical protein